MAKVLVADSQVLCRRGLMAVLQRDVGLTKVVEAGDFTECISAIGSDPAITLAVIDLSLPGMCEVAGLRQLRLHHAGVRVVVVGWSQDRNQVLATLAAGAHAYVFKQSSAADMATAFRAVLGGQIYIPAGVSDVFGSDPVQRPQPQRAGQPILTDRQREVLTLLSAGKSNKEIGRALSIAEGTVKVHIAAAFRVLGVHNRVSAAAALKGVPVRETYSDPLLPGLFDDHSGRGLATA
jgi:DNA-binding NarL/FixJ family response regulator